VIDGRPRSGQGRGTNVLVKRDEEWKMQHEHLSF
jgi:ketosteroid isomerase-like protein